MPLYWGIFFYLIFIWFNGKNNTVNFDIIKEVIKMLTLKEIKSKLKNNGDMVLIPNNKNSIYIHYGNYTFNKKMKYFLDYN